MTMKITLVVAAGETKEAAVRQTNGNPVTVLAGGDTMDVWLHFGNTFTVQEVESGTKAALVNSRVDAFAGTLTPKPVAEPVRNTSFSGFASTAPAHVALDVASADPLPSTGVCDLSKDQTCESCQ